MRVGADRAVREPLLPCLRDSAYSAVSEGAVPALFRVRVQVLSRVLRTDVLPVPVPWPQVPFPLPYRPVVQIFLSDHHH